LNKIIILGILLLQLSWNIPLNAINYPVSSCAEQNRTKLSVLEDKGAPASMRSVMRPQDFEAEVRNYINTLFLTDSSAQVKESINHVSDNTKGYLLQYVNTIDPSTLSLANANRLKTIVNALQTTSD
jgi:hypothetical protein